MPESDLDLLVHAVRTSGPIALGYAKDALDIVDKGDNQGPVTAADLAVNTHLCQTLQSARPTYGWLSEETPDDTDRLSRDHTFIIDPIDGTRAFIEGNDNWAHSVAIAHKGAVTAAAVFLPARDLMFTAALGQGAHLNGAPITVSPEQELSFATVLTTKPTMAPENWTTTPPFKRAFRSSLAFRLSLVAQGRFDAMITLRPAWEWDIAAGALIVAEAGGRASDRTGAALTFNNAHPKQNGVLAANSVLNTAIQALLAPENPPISG